jgi:DNA mismatch endonuclease (patch repair protein)
MKAYPLSEETIQVPRFSEENGFYTTSAISKQMARIRSKHTKPEIRLRKALFTHGVRFRTYNKNLPGHPDISIRKYKLAIFIDGEFWHGYDWSLRKKMLKSNQAFWIPKIERNKQRDRQMNQRLNECGYTVLRFWQQDIQKNLGACVHAILSYTASQQEPSQFLLDDI